MFQEQYYVLLPRLVARDTNCDTMFSHPECCYAVHRGLDVVKRTPLYTYHTAETRI